MATAVRSESFINAVIDAKDMTIKIGRAHV